MFPDIIDTKPLRRAVDDGLNWVVTNWGDGFEAAAHPLLVLLNAIQALLVATPWWLIVAILTGIAWLATRRWQLPLVVFVALILLGLMDLWNDAMITMALMIAATLSAIVISIPVGVWMFRSTNVRQVVTPVLDLMQTLPSFVYLIPTVMIFGPGKIPALLATIVYAAPPLIRLHVASFPGDPHNKADAQWFGKRLGGQTVSRGLDPNNNNFVCMGLLDPQTTGRSLTNVIGHTAFWMDDVGTKVPKARVDDWCKDHSLPPTLVTETSPGNYSYFWRFDAPVYRDLPLRANAVEAVRHRMKADGWGDPAAQDGARYMRLAGGVNGKKSYTDPFSGEPFRTRTIEWSPSNCVTVDAFAEAMLGPDWKTVAQSGEWLTSAQQLARLGGGGGSNERHASMDAPLVQLAAEIGLDPQPSNRAGVIDCHCPNEAAHTGGDPTGYAIINDGMSFCNHASCQHLRSPDFRDMMVERYDQMIAGGLLFGEYTDHPFSPGMVVRAADGEILPRDGDSFLARARFDKLDASSGGSVQEAVEQADGIASRQAAREQTRREQEQAAVEALADKLIHVDEAEAFWHREKHVLMTPSRLDRDEDPRRRGQGHRGQDAVPQAGGGHPFEVRRAHPRAGRRGEDCARCRPAPPARHGRVAGRWRRADPGIPERNSGRCALR